MAIALQRDSIGWWPIEWDVVVSELVVDFGNPRSIWESPRHGLTFK